MTNGLRETLANTRRALRVARSSAPLLLPGGRPTDAGEWHHGRRGEFVPRRRRPGHPILARQVLCPEGTLPPRRQPRALGRALLWPHGPLRLQCYCARRSDDTEASSTRFARVGRSDRSALRQRRGNRLCSAVRLSSGGEIRARQAWEEQSAQCEPFACPSIMPRPPLTERKQTPSPRQCTERGLGPISFDQG